MLIYEKDNKLNINFNPSLLEVGRDNPDIQIGENEIKLGDTEITSENVLPTPTSEDVGKVPTVQEDGSYALANAGGSNAPLICTDTEGTLDKTMNEIQTAYLAGTPVFVIVNDGRFDTYSSVALLIPVQSYEVPGGATRYMGAVYSSEDMETPYHVMSDNTESECLAAYPTK